MKIIIFTFIKVLFGFYSRINNKNVSIKNEDINKIDLKKVISLYKEKNKNIIKEWKNNITIRNGPMDIILEKEIKIIKIPLNYIENIGKINIEDIENIIKNNKNIKRNKYTLSKKNIHKYVICILFFFPRIRKKNPINKLKN